MRGKTGGTSSGVRPFLLDEDVGRTIAQALEEDGHDVILA